MNGAVTWEQVLVHRPPAERADIGSRLQAIGVTPELLFAVLADSGDALTAAFRSGAPGWANAFGGELGVAAVLTELQAHSAAVLERGAATRGQVYTRLLQQQSLAEVARAQGVSRQAVHKAARAAGTTTPHPERLRMPHPAAAAAGAVQPQAPSVPAVQEEIR